MYLSLLLLRWTKSDEHSCLSKVTRNLDLIVFLRIMSPLREKKNVCPSDKNYHVRKKLNENGCETLPTRRSQTANKGVHRFGTTWTSAPTFSLEKNQCWEFCIFKWLSINSWECFLQNWTFALWVTWINGHNLLCVKKKHFSHSIKAEKC